MSIQDENVTDNVPFRNCTARMTGGDDDDEEDMLKRSPASGTAVTANAPCSAPSSRGSRESRILPPCNQMYMWRHVLRAIGVCSIPIHHRSLSLVGESRILRHVTKLSGRAWFGVISSKVDDACVVKHDTDVVV